MSRVFKVQILNILSHNPLCNPSLFSQTVIIPETVRSIADHRVFGLADTVNPFGLSRSIIISYEYAYVVSGIGTRLIHVADVARNKLVGGSPA